MIALLVSVGESAPFVVLGLLLAGFVREFVPAATLERRLGGRGLAPVMRSVGLGALLPICSCSTIPLGLGMARSGAGTGTALAFMTSAPALSPVTIVLGLSLLGPALLGSYSLAVLCGSCAIGLLGNSIFKERDASIKSVKNCGCGCSHDRIHASRRVLSAVRWSLFDFGSEIALSLVAGLLISTVLLVFTPDDWVTSLIGRPTPLAILTVMLLSLPAYTCSVPALLIAGSLVAKGADPGLAVAFLVAGPATNLGELNAIRTGMGMRVAVFYFVVVATLAVGVALAIGNLPLPDVANTSMVALGHSDHGHSHLHFGGSLTEVPISGAVGRAIALWRWPFVALIVGLALYSLSNIVRRRNHHSHVILDAGDSPVTVATNSHVMEGGVQ
ncbi:MAG: permease [Planctomycetota bacterium]